MARFGLQRSEQHGNVADRMGIVETARVASWFD
jgi:hypothetical protein